MKNLKFRGIALPYCIFSFLILVLSSCTAKDEVRRTIEGMTGKPVVIDDKGLIVWKPKSSYQMTKRSPRPYTLLVYVDSAQCSECFVKGLAEWNQMLRLENDKRYDVQFVFIMEALKGKGNLLQRHLDESDFKHEVLIDEKACFRKANSQIPQDNIYHTFLLDRDYKIILVGNPLHNENIKKLFLKLLNGTKNGKIYKSD